MNAGRDLDALIAEKVMGLSVNEHGEIGEDSCGRPVCQTCKSIGYWGGAPMFGDEKCILPYSTDIKAAWGVVEKLTKWDEKEVPLYWFKCNYENNECWDIGFCRVEGHEDYSLDGWCWVTVQHFHEIPLAICLAALKAVGVEP